LSIRLDFYSHIITYKTYTEVKQILELLYEMRIELPSMQSLHKTILYGSSRTVFEGHEWSDLLQYLVQTTQPEINATFSCRSCGATVTLLHLACIGKNPVRVGTLLELGADTDCSGMLFPALTSVCALEKSQRGGSRSKSDEDIFVAIAKLLLDNGAEVNGRRTHENLSRSQPGNQSPCEHTPLMYASAQNQPEMVELLISHRADVNSGCISPLTFARRRKHKAVAKKLAESGARTWDYDEALLPNLDERLKVGQDRSSWRRDCGYCGTIRKRKMKSALATSSP
jgi:hypothetical protein